ncbi:uncharacterized protein PHACADRAFT_254150 [Phanerochaete carnosa HHB-10118-sp]|uniref:Uncharacterized protein n=1 Tax=Phanerochaete carnosa (strain HHB-10118-sp) TaxID=650164 RepID=K5VZ39_PHACS|nr:uncharacterized protein PHACADRAFT_254150 [Phanerochaete carnosa HHB-10118-sp]EKM56818.1 hypothetical protein PHACADRAFT_254150 [Phanerochaete carnosa HHB-10118-sp]
MQAAQQPTYPPPAHTNPRSVSIVSTQPKHSSSMSVSVPSGMKDNKNAAERLRGGCVPCPVRVFSCACATADFTIGWRCLLHNPVALLLVDSCLQHDIH